MIGKSSKSKPQVGKNWRKNLKGKLRGVIIARIFYKYLNLDRPSIKPGHLKEFSFQNQITDNEPPCTDHPEAEKQGRGQSLLQPGILVWPLQAILPQQDRQRRVIAKHEPAYVATSNVFVMSPRQFSTPLYYQFAQVQNLINKVAYAQSIETYVLDCFVVLPALTINSLLSFYPWP